jgi:hypothetical protein
MNTTDQAQGPIRVTYEGGNVTVAPDDDDRFVLIAQRAIQFYQDGSRMNEAIRTFKRQLLLPLFEWRQQHADRVLACYVSMPGSHVQVWMVNNCVPYDFNLGREMSGLELELADRGWQRISVMPILATSVEELWHWFKVKEAIEVYAQLAPTSGEGEQESLLPEHD